MRGDVGQVALARADRANQVLFDELELVADAAEGIIVAAPQGNAGLDGCCELLSFAFANQKYSARDESLAGKWHRSDGGSSKITRTLRSLDIVVMGDCARERRRAALGARGMNCRFSLTKLSDGEYKSRHTAGVAADHTRSRRRGVKWNLLYLSCAGFIS
jgi:hypothetical protein